VTALVSNKDFARVSQHHWYASVKKRKDGSVKAVYAANKRKEIVLMHRFILEITNPKVKVDHKNFNGLDNQRKNLRIATDVQNNRNKRIGSANLSGIKGVSWHLRDMKWQANIRVNSKSKFLGYFNRISDAKEAYNRAAKKYFGEFALLN
jgi:hypothetical protein